MDFHFITNTTDIQPCFTLLLLSSSASSLCCFNACSKILDLMVVRESVQMRVKMYEEEFNEFYNCCWSCFFSASSSRNKNPIIICEICAFRKEKEQHCRGNRKNPLNIRDHNGSSCILKSFDILWRKKSEIKLIGSQASINQQCLMPLRLKPHLYITKQISH